MCSGHFPAAFLRLRSYFPVPGNICLKHYPVASVQLLELCLIRIYKLELGLRTGAVFQGSCVLLWCYGVVGKSDNLWKDFVFTSGFYEVWM